MKVYIFIFVFSNAYSQYTFDFDVIKVDQHISILAHTIQMFYLDHSHYPNKKSEFKILNSYIDSLNNRPSEYSGIQYSQFEKFELISHNLDSAIYLYEIKNYKNIEYACGHLKVFKLNSKRALYIDKAKVQDLILEKQFIQTLKFDSIVPTTHYGSQN